MPPMSYYDTRVAQNVYELHQNIENIVNVSIDRGEMIASASSQSLAPISGGPNPRTTTNSYSGVDVPNSYSHDDNVMSQYDAHTNVPISGQQHYGMLDPAVYAYTYTNLPMAQASTAATSIPLTAEMLVNATPGENTRIAGEYLYIEVASLMQDPELSNVEIGNIYDKAGKITGTLLDTGLNEVFYLLDNPSALKERVQEAVHILKEHEENKDTVPAASPDSTSS